MGMPLGALSPGGCANSVAADPGFEWFQPFSLHVRAVGYPPYERFSSDGSEDFSCCTSSVAADPGSEGLNGLLCTAQCGQPSA